MTREEVADTVSPVRMLGMGVASIIGFALGVYLAIYLVLASLDWGQPFENELILLAVAASTALAALGGVLAAPRRGQMWKPIVVGASVAGLIGLVVLLLIEADPVVLILVGLGESMAIVAGARMAV